MISVSFYFQSCSISLHSITFFLAFSLSFSWFFLRWVPDVLMVFVVLYSFCFFLSHLFRFFVHFFLLIPFSLLAPVGYLPDSCFFSVFLHCFQPSFNVFCFFCNFEAICSPTHYIFLLLSIFFSPSLYLILSGLIF